MLENDFQRGSSSLSLTKNPFILVVDDDIDQLFVFRLLLERKGFTVVTASSAEEAEEVVSQVHVDLVLCDVNMPKVSGRELVERLRRSSDLADLPIIVFSADMRYEAQEFIEIGANAYFPKTQIRRLVPAIEKLLSEVSDDKPLLTHVKSRFSQ